MYLYGHAFTLCTDHKPLLGLFGSTRPIPTVISIRIQRWILTVGAYNLNIVHRPGKDNAKADALSRLLSPNKYTISPPIPEVLHLITHVNSTVMDIKQVRQMTQKDTILSQVYMYVKNGWPNNITSSELLPYFRR